MEAPPPIDATGTPGEHPVVLARRLLQGARYRGVVEVLTRALALGPEMALSPDAAEAYFLLGDAYQCLGKLDDALASYRRAIKLQPRHALAHNNMGGAFQHQGRLDAAIACYRQALALKPDFPEAFNNLGGALQLQGRLDESIDQYHSALALRPYYPDANSSLLMAMAGHSKTTPQEYLTLARQYGEKMRARATPFADWPANSSSMRPGKLRVGLVSGELRANPVGYFLESCLASLDRDRIELLAFPTNRQEDALTRRIKPLFCGWHPIAGLGDAAAANTIHAAAPHILVDLAGHTAGNRLPVFAWKPAPVQVSWLGFFASTGVPGMDYLLADRDSVPESNRDDFSESIWHLPETRLCFTEPGIGTDAAPLPALRNGFVTFGSFQRLTKFNDAVLAAWGEIFRALPEARLRLQMIEMRWSSARDDLLQRLEAVGVARARVTVLPQASRAEYLAAHAQIDVVLDTFPFPGGTTTCEALWMGVPTLTLDGQTLLSRQGASLMRAAGLADWVAGSVEDYVSRAIGVASSIDALADLRARMRAMVSASPLFDAPRFARHLEDAFHGMWERHLSQRAGHP
jgi:protein O-GlcNAc transferase